MSVSLSYLVMVNSQFSFFYIFPYLWFPVYDSLTSVVNIVPVHDQQTPAAIYSGWYWGDACPSSSPTDPVSSLSDFCCCYVPHVVAADTWTYFIAFFASSPLEMGHRKNYFLFLKRNWLERKQIYGKNEWMNDTCMPTDLFKKLKGLGKEYWIIPFALIFYTCLHIILVCE